MSKYSSDSDSDFERSRSSKKSYSSRNRDRLHSFYIFCKNISKNCTFRSYSSDSSSSRSRKRKDKKYKRDRSRSSEKYSKRRDRSSSRHRNRYYVSKSKHSTSPDRSRRRSTSKDRQKLKYRSKRSRSDSRHRRRNKKYDKYKNRSESDSSSSSSDSYEKKEENRVKDKFNKVNDMISRNPITEEEQKMNSSILDEINNDSFTPKQFSSSSKPNKKILDNIVIDLKSQTIKVPDVEITEPDSIFHPNVRNVLSVKKQSTNEINTLFAGVFRQFKVKSGRNTHFSYTTVKL